jgi:phosphate transport system permease protein
MTTTTLLLLLSGLGILAYLLGRDRAIHLGGGSSGTPGNLHSLPEYYGYYCIFWSVLPALAVLCAWEFVEARVIIALVAAGLPEELGALTAGQLDLFLNTVRNAAMSAELAATDAVIASAATRYQSLLAMSHWLIAGTTIALAVIGMLLALRMVQPAFRARNRVEAIVQWFLMAASSVAILTTVGIVLSVLFEALRFFEQVSLIDFLFGTTWSPQTAIREDQIGSSGSFGLLPLLAGTLLITVIAMLVAVPVGLMSSIYMAEYASDRTRAIVKPSLEVLAGIPTVVYGFFAVLTIAPWIRDLGAAVGLEVASESALAAGVVTTILYFLVGLVL